MFSSAGNLRDIEFKMASAQVLSLADFPRILIRWELKTTTQNLKNLKFVVYRGESPEDMSPITAEIASDQLYEYVDTEPSLRMFQKHYIYKVIAREYRSNAVVQTFESNEFAWQIGEDLVGLYIVEEHEFKYRYIAGAPALILKRKRDTTHCPECWDVILKRVTKSNCQTCYGTGTLGGFYTPFPIWMDFNPEQKIDMVAEFGEKQVGQNDAELTNYPLLDSGDVIVEVLPNKLWRVESVFLAEKRQTVLRQLVRLSHVNKTDIEYKLPLDEEIRVSMVDEFRAIRDETEF